MLHAITQKKGTLYKRYLGHREDGQGKVHEEDELTAILLGPLALLPPAVSARFWCELLRARSAPGLPEGYPEKAEMVFWPSRWRDGKRIEPDLHVKLTWPGNRQYSLLVELKWRSPLSGEWQLHDQWERYLFGNERNYGWHMFIGIETSGAQTALAKRDNWAGKLLPISWYQILGIIEQIQRDHNLHELHPWALQVQRALDRLNIRRFLGFRHMSSIHHTFSQGNVFWKGESHE
ncbi:hypothetical protein Selin_0398 [Desulfurispirillum indicum S5]|uniref:Uncharacterized protein n=1 Tax=Desulfurispirillum indicum (strain ATCC BAA-1389 / DSM 22839 / S5) TaxID=653733 RepID=E6W026_DESIS|nr:hypothetical protein [Desulfurispirillum indicum]ADU65152.1 hypothetical protein Selin_0398 [Desulfurispirillum indicum S5]